MKHRLVCVVTSQPGGLWFDFSCSRSNSLVGNPRLITRPIQEMIHNVVPLIKGVKINDKNGETRGTSHFLAVHSFYSVWSSNTRVRNDNPIVEPNMLCYKLCSASHPAVSVVGQSSNMSLSWCAYTEVWEYQFSRLLVSRLYQFGRPASELRLAGRTISSSRLTGIQKCLSRVSQN